MNPVVLVSSIQHVSYYLQNIPFYTPPCIYGYRFSIQREKLILGDLHGEIKDFYSIRIWKTKSFLDWWIDEQSCNTFIGALEYIIEEDHVKCEYMSIRDFEELGYTNYNSKISLTDTEICELSSSFIRHMKLVAEKRKNPKSL